MYEKQTWKTGDVITEEKLNHMEEGIGSCVFPVSLNNDEGSLNKTWQEIFDAMNTGKIIIINQKIGGSPACDFVTVASSDDANYYVSSVKGNEYITTSADGYPTMGGVG